MSDEWEDYEETASLTDCTCDHDGELHDWESCVVDGCPCQGHWEE